MGAAFLCGVAGIEQATLENSSAYLASWIKRLHGDARLVITAAAQAQRGADRILGIDDGGGATAHPIAEESSTAA